MNRMVRVKCSPSLALIKYWGKEDVDKNIPATSSLAVTLNSLCTTSDISLGEKDCIIINGDEQDSKRFKPFFENIRKSLHIDQFFICKSHNNFPTAAGLASSSSGFAALALGINSLLELHMPLDRLSQFARVGSASAARAVFGGYTILPRGSENARALYKSDYWNELRLIVVSVDANKKKVSSRSAMGNSKESSPFYNAWVEDSENIYEQSLVALGKKDLTLLGPLMRKSYLRMFSTMFSADPPLIYWQETSLGLIRMCEDLREKGISAWETMDAGPQVKIFCLEKDLQSINSRIKKDFPYCSTIIDSVGGAPQIEDI